jgi:ABC-2 type transport system ATP-binding protein
MISSHLLAMVEDLCTHVLILAGGEQRFFGPLEELRESFDHKEADARLEDMFFAATAP